jgi:3-isopropylmalate dehydrogenase
MAFRIVALPGDGIGSEVMSAGRELLHGLEQAFGLSFEVEELPVGGGSIDEHSVPLLPEVLERCRAADAVLVGAVGGPKW